MLSEFLYSTNIVLFLLPWFNTPLSLIGLIMENGTCISLENCPCTFHGLAYSVGSKIEQECTEWYVIIE